MFGRDVYPAGGTGFEICASGCQAGTIGTGDVEFNTPSGVAVDSADSIFVVDRDNQSNQKFDYTGSLQFTFGTKGSGSSQFQSTSQIVIDRSNNL